MKAYAIYNTLNEAVGIYWPSRPAEMISGVIELIADYQGVKHNELAQMVAPDDKHVKSVSCMMNVNYLEGFIARPPITVQIHDLQIRIPVAESLVAHYSAADVCKMFGITRRTLSNWEITRGLRPTKRGNKNMYAKAAVDKLK